MSAWTLCIDFGTAFSKAAAAPRNAWTRFDPGAVRPLMLGAVQEAGNAFLLESAIFVDEERILFGRAAIARANALAQKKRMALRSFKTLLSADDIDRALNANAPASYDPHRIFQMRDLVVLYLAYLLAAVEDATERDEILQRATTIHRRCAAPAWPGADPADTHAAITRLFGEAELFRIAAGDRLLNPDGISIDTVDELLPQAQQDARPYNMALIFEAPAAAAYSSIGLESGASHFIVVDVGAGTTDFAALVRRDEALVELPDARVTLKQAGDFLDQVIANVGLKASRESKTAAQTELWRTLMAQMRDFKETLFADGRASFRHNGKLVTITMSDVARDRDFKDFMSGLEQAYARGLTAVAKDAGKTPGEIQAIAVGGGASAPFIQALIRNQVRGAKVRVKARPATPAWAHAREFQGNLAPIFPQLAIAIGGALAPDTMLAARGDD